MARGRSLAEFQKAFADEASCATFLFKRRWPDGFVCPACGRRRANALKTRPRLFEFKWPRAAGPFFPAAKLEDRLLVVL